MPINEELQSYPWILNTRSANIVESMTVEPTQGMWCKEEEKTSNWWGTRPSNRRRMTSYLTMHRRWGAKSLFCQEGWKWVWRSIGSKSHIVGKGFKLQNFTQPHLLWLSSNSVPLNLQYTHGHSIHLHLQSLFLVLLEFTLSSIPNAMSAKFTELCPIPSTLALWSMSEVQIDLRCHIIIVLG